MKELARLTMIVASLGSIAWAGQVAQSETIRPEPAVASAEGNLAGFATSEIKKLSELHEALIERAELLPEGWVPSDQAIRGSLDDLDASLTLSRLALSKLKAAAGRNRVFQEENLKSQIFRLQESAREAQMHFIAREKAQSFNVSRTGQ